MSVKVQIAEMPVAMANEISIENGTPLRATTKTLLLTTFAIKANKYVIINLKTIPRSKPDLPKVNERFARNESVAPTTNPIAFAIERLVAATLVSAK